jgi:hypothetical protein
MRCTERFPSRPSLGSSLRWKESFGRPHLALVTLAGKWRVNGPKSCCEIPSFPLTTGKSTQASNKSATTLSGPQSSLTLAGRLFSYWI